LLRHALSGDPDVGELHLAAVNRRGRHITVRVTCSPLTGDGAKVSGAIIVMETDEAPLPAVDPTAE
jgi:two-component system CheB/CheR fusion protein